MDSEIFFRNLKVDFFARIDISFLFKQFAFWQQEGKIIFDELYTFTPIFNTNPLPLEIKKL